MPASTAGWLATMPTGAPVQARESDDNVVRVVLLHFEEVSVVDHGVDHVLACRKADSIAAGTIVSSAASARSTGSVHGLRGGSSRLFDGTKAQQLAHHRQALGIVMRHKMRHA